MSVTISTPEQGEGAIRRSVLAQDNLSRFPAPHVETLYDVLQYSVTKRPNHSALGYRTLEKMIQEEKEVTKIIDGVETKQKKTWNYFQLSPYTYVSYTEMSTKVHTIGNGLSHLGLKPKSKIEIFAPTSAEWMYMAYGAFTQNITIVTAYDTLGEEGLLHSMNETGAEAVFTSSDLLPVVLSILPKCTTKPIVIYTGEAKKEVLEKVSELATVYTVNELVAIGEANPKEPVKPVSEDLACIMYTSGSTGNPKGVMLEHSNLVAAIAGVNTYLGHHFRPDDTIMAYLPLAHVLEFLVESLALFLGMTLGYGSPRTLTDASVRNCQGDIKEFKPSIMTGVPQVWESIRKGVVGNVSKASPTAQAMFQHALSTKSWLMKRHLPTGWIDRLVFSKVKEQVGGRLRFGLSGGAPLALETQEFLSSALAPILGGYGMTESCGMACIMSPEYFGYGHVGLPVPCTEIKLVDVPEANYLSTNQPKPQGEVWVRGPSICRGYYKQEKLTKETITEDGWLRTGDVGEWNEDGTLSVIDRIKNLVKLSNGEYIALEKLESVYKTVMGVSNVCVYGDSLRPKPVALVVPVESQLRKLAKTQELEVANASFEDLCQNEQVRKLVLDQLLAQAKKAQLKPAELICNVYLCHEEWTSTNGLMTAAQKLKRHEINKTYKQALDDMNAAQKA
ncbi:uncharacterized protein BX664DRAFT_332692 [Halteromyces radiatus]|uniref:uncharacterized protein n=1 Tax=Halteromyces radiatus TaxID=101107 RepID=UPI00221FBB9E|nr:uncharacterized protein BX664DRAFT_332692 [Halteromyces radiatus]KAI8089309.1 hypothetical protein BX664DRAFT_332692 [Halteromyces radiatus]